MSSVRMGEFRPGQERVKVERPGEERREIPQEAMGFCEGWHSQNSLIDIPPAIATVRPWRVREGLTSYG